jgi:hypothetical protein
MNPAWLIAIIGWILSGIGIFLGFWFYFGGSPAGS